MKLDRVLPVALMLLAFPSAFQAEAGTITFDDAPTGCTPISSDRYQSQGVLLSTNGTSLFLFRSPIDTQNRFVFGSSTTDPQCGDFGGNADRDVNIDFVLPGTLTPGFTDEISFPVINDDSPTATFLVSVFGPGGVLIASFPGVGSTEFVFSRPEGDIHRVTLTPVNSLEALGWPFRFGEITRVPGEVAEPGIFALLCAGLLGLAARRHRAR